MDLKRALMFQAPRKIILIPPNLSISMLIYETFLHASLLPLLNTSTATSVAASCRPGVLLKSLFCSWLLNDCPGQAEHSRPKTYLSEKNGLVDKGLRECGWVLMSFRQEWKQCSRRVMFQKKKKKERTATKQLHQVRFAAVLAALTEVLSFSALMNIIHTSNVAPWRKWRSAFEIFFFPLHDQIPPKVAKPSVWTESIKTIKFQQRPQDFQILKCCACVGCTASNGTNKQLQFPHFAAFSQKGNALRANHLCNVNDGERVNL